MKDSVEATLRSLRAKLELEAAFGSEGALRFLIRIAPDHFTIKIRLDQADAFRTAARRRLPGRSIAPPLLFVLPILASLGSNGLFRPASCMERSDGHLERCFSSPELR